MHLDCGMKKRPRQYRLTERSLKDSGDTLILHLILNCSEFYSICFWERKKTQTKYHGFQTYRSIRSEKFLQDLGKPQSGLFIQTRDPPLSKHPFCFTQWPLSPRAGQKNEEIPLLSHSLELRWPWWQRAGIPCSALRLPWERKGRGSAAIRAQRSSGAEIDASIFSFLLFFFFSSFIPFNFFDLFTLLLSLIFYLFPFFIFPKFFTFSFRGFSCFPLSSPFLLLFAFLSSLSSLLFSSFFLYNSFTSRFLFTFGFSLFIAFIQFITFIQFIALLFSYTILSTFFSFYRICSPSYWKIP